MTTQFPSVQKIERYTGTAWEDISHYCITDLVLTNIGIQTQDFGDRLAAPASLAFTINNKGDVFNPNTDFKRKTPIKITIEWVTLSRVFYFYVMQATPSSHTELNKTIEINATDWFGLALRNLLRHVPVEQDLTIDEAVTELLTYAPNQPNSTDFDIGTETFQIVFDAIRNGRTTLYAELYNLILSELGYMYLNNNETLVIENANARKGNLTPTVLSYSTGVPTGAAIKKMDGGYLRLMSGGKILLAAEETISIGPEFPRPINIERSEGEVLNKIIVTVMPRQVDFGVGNKHQLYTYNLYDENPPITIPTGATIVIEGGYPESLGNRPPDSAIDITIPTYPDYFSFNLGPDGADDLVHTFIAGADSWKWTITNNGASGSITAIEIFGRPIFNSQPLSYTAEDQVSQDEHDVKSATYDLIYRQELDKVTSEIDLLLSRQKDPREIIKSISFCANLDAENMANFMLSEIGHLRRVLSPSLDIDKYAFIQGMDVTIKIGGNIYPTYKLKELEQSLTISPIALRYSGVGSSKNVLVFDPIKKLESLTVKTLSIWIYPRTIVSGAALISKRRGATSINDYGWELWMLAGGSVDGMIQYVHGFSTNWGIWQTPLNTMNSKVNGWHNIIVKYNSSSTSNNPIIKVDDVLQTLTEAETPSGTSRGDVGIPLHIGNQSILFADRMVDFWGSIKDVRIYNRETTDEEDTLIVSNEDDYTVVPDFIFNAPFVETDDLADYIGNPITPDMKIIESVDNNIGTVRYDTSIVNGEVKGETP